MAANNLKLREYQSEAIDSLFNYFDNKGGTDSKTGLPVSANPLVALPCGTGKSVILAYFIKRALEHYPSTRIIMATHIKTLIKQNHKKIKEAWPIAPVGLYSAGLKKRDNLQPIIYGGIRSMAGKYPMFGYRDILCIDEAHLVSEDDEASYIKFIWELKYGAYVKPGEPPTKEQFQKALDNLNCNPYLKIVGLSATCFRQGLGWLTNGRIFTDICYNLCTIEGYGRLFAEGYLSPIYPRPTATTFNTDGIKITGGDFNQAQLEAKFDRKDITAKCLNELLQHAQDRHCGLIFALSIAHAEHIAELMNNTFGEECVIIHSGNKEFPRTDAENDEALELWLKGQVKWAVNMNALTTGVDNPNIDIIAFMRSTLSSVLWVQGLGRGTRPVYANGYDLDNLQQRHEALRNSSKRPCVVLDFAGNTPRLGPIDDPKIPKQKSGNDGEMPVKICGVCGTYNHARATECLACATPFPVNSKLTSNASTQALLRSETPIVETFNVQRVVYQSYTAKATQRSMIKAAYYCEGLKTFYEFITVESKIPGEKVDYAVKKGRDWFRQRAEGEPPLLNDVILANSQWLRVPKQINVWTNKAYPEILGAIF